MNWNYYEERREKKQSFRPKQMHEQLNSTWNVVLRIKKLHTPRTYAKERRNDEPHVI